MRRGFTLTEIAIVLGIIGVILGAIWSAAAMVYANNRTKLAVAETLQIVANYRSIFSRGLETIGTVDVTCTGVNNGAFPAEMVKSETPCKTNDLGTYPSSPWGIAVVGGGQFVQVFTDTNINGFIVSYFHLTRTACNAFSNAVIAGGSDVVWASIQGVAKGDGTIGSVSFTTSDIDAACTNDSNVEVGYAYR